MSDRKNGERAALASKPLEKMSAAARSRVRYVLTDIDGTLTGPDGRLPAKSYSAMQRLRAAGIKVIPITGRPAGWCDHIARMWPADGVVGENGALFYMRDDSSAKMIKIYSEPSSDIRASNMKRLLSMYSAVKRKFPSVEPASDQNFRETDVAIDYCEDVRPPLTVAQAFEIKKFCESRGATAKVSNIHVNAWFGDYTKLKMSKRILRDIFGETDASMLEKTVYAGDSDNDAEMFGHFKLSVGMADVRAYADSMPRDCHPKFVAPLRGADGFCRLAAAILEGRALKKR
jgi:hypothetical protein